MKWKALLAVALLAGAPALAEGPHNYVPPSGVVPDGRTAVQIAEAVLTPIYGSKQVQSERPYTATLKGDTWIVMGTLCPREKPGTCVGGVAQIEISRRDGRVTRITHGK